MHIGHDLHTVYTMEDGNKIIQSESTLVEKDLGVWAIRDLKPSEQCIQSARKARAVLGMVKRQFKETDREDFGIVYNTYVRLDLEYCVQAWSPHLQKDKACLGRVQRPETDNTDGEGTREIYI